MKILVTGFDPFGGEPINPAIESVKRLPDNIEGAEIIKLEIPTVRKKSLEKIEKAINEHNPDVILSIGQAGGRFDISIERVGINLDDFRIPILLSYLSRLWFRMFKKTIFLLLFLILPELLYVIMSYMEFFILLRKNIKVKNQDLFTFHFYLNRLLIKEICHQWN